MDLLALRYFQAVARTEHVSRAADQLRIAQPALSRVLKRLESDLGVRLFDRRGRNLRLNSFGATFLRRVDRALAELDDGRRELADAVGLEHGRVSIATETLRRLTPMLTAFLTDHPEIDVRLAEAAPAAMVRQLRDGTLDLAFASQPLTDPELRSRALLREEVLLALPATHRLASRDRVAVAELAGERLIVNRPGHWLRVLTDRLLVDAGVEADIVCECDEPTVMVDLIDAGLGIGLAPAMARAAEPRVSAVAVRLDHPDSFRTLSVVWREDAYVSPARRELLEHAVRFFRAATA
ncbi:LysR family transcriptional regulator [Microlunatus speluncae]|uniref:LysR family transcriptional regulator n=1 Tax=Microlunatus speluncae TaxID=2594267 RepID=UPI0012667EB0|nr:LysR family transcriptional regulator [Microlunatus speluncae]